MFEEENELDRICRIVLADMVYVTAIAELTIKRMIFSLTMGVQRFAFHLKYALLSWRIDCKYALLRVRTDVYYVVIFPWLMLFGLKQAPTWASIEAHYQELETRTGVPYRRSAEHLEGLKREQQQKEEA